MRIQGSYRTQLTPNAALSLICNAKDPITPIGMKNAPYERHP